MLANRYKLLVLFSFLVLASSLFAQEPRIDYTSLTVKQLVNDLKGRALLPAASEVTVAGQVVVSQRIKIEKQLDLIEAIAISGGLTPKAEKMIRIIRMDASGRYAQEHSVNIRDIQTGKQETTQLQPGDVIIALKKRDTNFSNLINLRDDSLFIAPGLAN